MRMEFNNLDIAVIIPCYNEETTIGKVVSDFKTELPEARIYVFDNNSSDQSAKIASQAGAIVVKEKRQGKGFVIASMFRKIEADFYIMVDGDDTYPADRVHDLLKPLIQEEADMVVGNRLSKFTDDAFRPLHVFGNHIICSLINLVFSSRLKDPLSGFRAFNRDLVKHIPVVASGFDVETEMTLQILYRHYVIHEIEIPYRERPRGSLSKLNTFSDGFVILRKIFSILRAYKPLTFFGGIGLMLSFAGFILGIGPIFEIIVENVVYSVPNAIFAAIC
ncbi:MAG: glycosyltransferase, partial [Anaerolineaceae bacterium]|nr:glycosyltransferase [Anaerolineaceae bacterium]